MRERFFGAYRLELYQIFRQWSYWLIQALLLVYMFSTFGDAYFFTARELLWAGASRNVIGLSSLIVLFLGAFGAGRARRARIDVLEATLPTGAEVPLARWAALITASLPFLVSALGIALIAGPFESFLGALPVFLFESLLTIVITASLVWLIETTVGIRRWMFPVLAFLWVGAIASMSLTTIWALAPWAGQLNFTRFSGSSYTEAWGRLAQGNFPWLLNLFYAGMVILLAGLIVRAAERRRFYRVSPRTWAVAGVGAAVALSGYLVYGMNFLSARALADSSLMMGYSFSTNDLPEPDSVPHSVTRYDVALDLAGMPSFDVSMDVRNDSAAPVDTLEFTLIETVAVQEANVAFAQDGDLLILKPEAPLAPGESLTVELRYAGDVVRYLMMWGQPPEYETFVTPEGIYLPFGASWYPHAGHHDLADEQMMVNRMLDVVDVHPAPFRLRVTGTDMPLASNLPRTGEGTFESTGATWTTLIGAPLLETHEIADGVSVVTTKHQYAQMRDYLEQGLHALRPLVSRYFPADVVLILTNPRWYTVTTPTLYQPYPMAETAAVVAYPAWAGGDHWFYEYGVYAPAQHYFGDTRMTLLTENVAQFVYLQYQYDGDPERMLAEHRLRLENFHHGMPPSDEQQELLYASPGFSTNYAITEKLIAVFAAHGTDGVASLLEAMRAEAAMLKVTIAREVVAWIDGWVAENLSDA